MKSFCASLVLSALLLINLFVLPVRANDEAAGQTVDSMQHEKYTGQTSIQCNGMTINIPPFKASSSDDPEHSAYIHFTNEECTEDFFEMSIDVSQDCYRIHACNMYSFSRSHTQTLPNGKQRALDEDKTTPSLGDAITAGMKAVMLDKKITGYIVPSRLYAYPTSTQIIWMNGDYLYEIRQKGGDDEDLIKSANSLINAP
ncbi:MAG: hypothetical protein LRZ85_08980 [Alphaproteobacteria bacterium]|nr:hypothetical protein [Alphaproteobacteria bacterium]MCD8520515.1 hypothetical protein [Alphaproteobacteria bacterium]MCD8570642.1 hypothetical protein [Alphaproteobacteria bacterium]